MGDHFDPVGGPDALENATAADDPSDDERRAAQQDRADRQGPILPRRLRGGIGGNCLVGDREEQPIEQARQYAWRRIARPARRPGPKPAAGRPTLPR